MIDIHQHIVYGMDDGAEDAETSFAMLSLAAKQGITEIVCTSHITPGYLKFDMDRYLRHMEKMRKYLEQERIDITLHAGAEILYTQETPGLLTKGLVPTLGDSKSVLVEFLPSASIDFIKDAVLSLNYAGYLTVIAHAERYNALHNTLDTVYTLKKDFSAYIQVNANSILNGAKLFGDPWIKGALKEELVDVVASDTHNTTARKCRLSEAYAVIKKKYGVSRAERLFSQNAGSILQYRKP